VIIPASAVRECIGQSDYPVPSAIVLDPSQLSQRLYIGNVLASEACSGFLVTIGEAKALWKAKKKYET